MKRKFMAIFAVGLLVQVATGNSAEIDWQKIYFIPAEAASPAKTLDIESGRINAVLAAMGGEKPPDCPPDAFWYTDNELSKLSSCLGMATFTLEKPKDAGLAAKGWFGLVPIVETGPGEGTNDPGPSVEPK